VRIQANTDSGFKEDGVTPEIVNERASFSKTLGYGAVKQEGIIVTKTEERMIMLCGARPGATRLTSRRPCTSCGVSMERRLEARA